MVVASACGASAYLRWQDASVASGELLSEARAAFAERSWERARAAFADASRSVELPASDLEAWGLSALLTGHDRESDAARERAHHAYLDDGDFEGAARVAFWLGLSVLMRGEPGRAQGWFARPRSIFAPDAYDESVWRGYESLNFGMRSLMTHDAEQSERLLADAVAVARRHHDVDLELLARNGHAQALLALGRMVEGMAELDEVMVLATTSTANPQAVGQVYCAAILVCRSCLDLARSAEWTDALSRWCESQPALVHYRGQCVVHRSEVLQLRGQWDAATDEVAAILDRLERDQVRVDAALGMAHYQRGELHRMRGESREAERAYRDALAAGHDPQPGLALLRMAQGRADGAKLALQRALAESPTGFLRTRLLPALVEVALAAGDLAAARTAARELEAAADRLQTPYLNAVFAQCDGAIALAEDRPAGAIGPLRAALHGWAIVGAPYDAARCRILLSRACRQLGDVETAELETETARRALTALGARHDLSVLDAAKTGKGAAAHGLTPREVEVLRLLATGQSNRQIAEEFVLSERTVARHVANIFVKIGVSSRAAATAYAYDAHLV